MFLTHVGSRGVPHDLIDAGDWHEAVPIEPQRAAEQLRAAWFEPVDDVAECVRARLATAGAGARLAVLPQGPQTIPYIAG